MTMISSEDTGAGRRRLFRKVSWQSTSVLHTAGSLALAAQYGHMNLPGLTSAGSQELSSAALTACVVDELYADGSEEWTDVLEAESSAPLILMPPSPTVSTATDSIDRQEQTFPPHPNPYPLHTSHFIGTYSAPNIAGYANSGALVAQTQSAGGHVGITSYPSQEVQHLNFSRSETIPPSNIEDFHVQSNPGLASDYIPPSQSYPSDFNVDHGEVRSYYIAAVEDLWAGGVPEINFNDFNATAYATSDPTVQSNYGHTDAGNVVVPNRTNIENVGNLSLNSDDLNEPLPNISKSVPNKTSHGILPFTSPEERNTGAYISSFTTRDGRPFFGCLWKGCRELSFWEHVKAHDHVYNHFLEKGYECSCGANFATELTARRHCRKQADINKYVCPGCAKTIARKDHIRAHQAKCKGKLRSD
ncbi:hypothetical protein M422DRAFT_245228 [Sphaerobolus stellatus SS14]|nr:hypothetical protein M422DRAFT_245228 [Sphaerobolus stellatus SS14]